MSKTKVVAVPGARVEEAEGKKNDRDQMRKFVETINNSWYEFSLIANRVYRNESFKSWGFESFKDYVETELGIEYRIAMWRVQIGDAIEQHGVTREMLAGMGWTKFQALIPVLQKGNHDQVVETIENAKDKTVREVRVEVDRAIARANGGEPLVKTKMAFLLEGDNHKIVQAALEKAMEVSGTGDPNKAIVYICGEWVLNHNPKFAEQFRTELEKREAEVKAKVVAKPRKIHASKGKVAKKAS